AEKKEYYDLSAAQKRLYILQQIDLHGTVYNMPQIIPLVKGTDTGRLEDVLKKLIQRHESLRTSFHIIQPKPVTPKNQSPITNNSFFPAAPGEVIPIQKVHDAVKFKPEKYRATTLNEAKEQFIRPFDLSKAPLLRVAVVEIPGTGKKHHEQYMLMDMHHIITDGTSQEVLKKEFLALYDGENLPPLKLQYRDYAERQAAAKQTPYIKQQEETWLNIYAGEYPMLELPLDNPRPAERNTKGKMVEFQLNEEKTVELKETAREIKPTLYMTLLAVYTIMLSKLGGQEDIVVGTPIAGRRHADLENIIGMFLNTLAMRNYPAGEKTFRQYLKEVKERTIQAYENQEYPFEDLVDKVTITRDTTRNPLFDTMFNLLNITTPGPTRRENSEDIQHKETASKFDMSLTAGESTTGIRFNLTYAAALFKEETIERIIGYIKKIIHT
ncbi:MAG: non-ribosomal peptide synthetase, partial [bacterium]|nr:non-ribosomal peptide synthetase [bacterium]